MITVEYIVKAAFGIIVFLVLLAIVYYDYCKTKEYNNAGKTQAKVISKAGLYERANYGRGQARTKYVAYVVEYYIDGSRQEGTHLEKKDCYEIGDTVEIRYVHDNSGYKVVNRDIKDRFYRLLLTACLGFLWAGIIIVLKRMGKV